MQRALMRRLFWIAAALALAGLAALAAIDGHLQSPAAPLGIISFEFCAYAGSCRAIVEGWGAGEQVMAGLSLGVDYLFMFMYSATIFLGLTLVVAHVPERLRNLTVCAAWAAWVAGAADAVENYCLVQVLRMPAALQFAWPAAICATVKFAIVAFALAWLLVAYLRFVRPALRAAGPRAG
jgi:hypothetical protein